MIPSILKIVDDSEVLEPGQEKTVAELLHGQEETETDQPGASKGDQPDSGGNDEGV